jgi:hypothetical protein
MVVLTLVALFSTAVFAGDSAQKVEIIKPDSVVKIDPMTVNHHPSTLEGKTVLLRGNGKHNADNVLDRVGELLEQNVKDVKVIRLYKLHPETFDISQGDARSLAFAQTVASYKPDLVIGSQAD